MPDLAPRPPADPLDQSILYFDASDPFTIRDACEGVQIFGGIGSGKTSGSGAHLARSFLGAGFGGVVLTAKTDETALWQAYAKATGRSQDLILFGAKHPSRFNVLEYERTRSGAGAGLTENLVGLFDTLAQVASRGGGGSSGGENDAFWRNEQRKLLRNAIDLLRLADMAVTLPDIYRVILSAPQSPEMLEDPNWKTDSLCYSAINAATERGVEAKLTPGEQTDYQMTISYWTKEFPYQDERPRSSTVSLFTGMADVLLRGILRELFSSTTTFTPEDTLDGKIIILDLPQKQFNEVGVYAQVLFKYCWQRAIERRVIQRDSRPVFLWVDESQHFVNEYDVTFQTTARSSRACTVLLTQNLPNYLFTLGGTARSQALVDSLLGNLVTKIFHNNTCAATNKYAADLFARDWRQIQSSSVSQADGRFTTGSAQAALLEHTVLPREFTGLAKGGPPHDFTVEAIVHQGGKVFQCSGSNALKTAFRQAT